jgi:alkanesulfonate monooxygenase SsuD/methylene tetrahydromethanopterin reductase-like flavin-dependent oxidoreductase (luciferase family)
MDTGDHPSFVSLRADHAHCALSAVTSHVGLGATVSTSFGEPFHVARAFASLDHLSGGRAAWNVVTSSNAVAALNFSKEQHHEHDLRYEIATEFVDVVRGLWDCWDDDAMLADPATGMFVDPGKVHPLNHKGRFFR